MKPSLTFWTRLGHKWNARLKALFLLAIGLYKAIGAVHLGGACRFEPSCSDYAVYAVKDHGILRALSLILIRLSKCRPGGPWGYDPVPSTCGGDEAHECIKNGVRG